MKKQEKTNAVRLAAQKNLDFNLYSYDSPGALSGTEVAEVLGKDPNSVFKTLVTEGKSGQHYVFMIPVNEELNLKKAAAAAGEKSISMIKSKELLPLTGYIHGGCSPIGMKKYFPTYIHSTAENYPSILFSGGRIGLQLEMSLASLREAIAVTSNDLI